MSSDEPKLEPVCELRVSVGKMEELGDIGKGVRRVIPITGGTFSGADIKGTILSGGYDWQIIRSDGVAELEARYVLKTDDGSLITVVNKGLRHGPPEVMKRLAKGEEVDPSEYYFRAIPEFEVAAKKYDWLNKSIFISTGIRKPDAVIIKVWRVL